MTYFLPKSWLSKFRNDERGSVALEAMLTLPLLIWAVGATYELFEVQRYSSARDKASYTVADMISREMIAITPIYMNNAKTVFDTISNDDGENSLRVSVIKYDVDEDEYFVKWSEVRGPSLLIALTTADVKTAHDTLPIMGDGEELIIVDSLGDYSPMFDVGISKGLQIATHVFTSPRFAPQINWDDS
ncbi:pilus assembly protein [Roseovarius sp. Pro17]|uniref:TadE/TadG family type IV pilus assembly protein n=1 Tax=Roseovarius sp. Pro17 TaxID=3108175 RepID=UPI002D772C4D|nr:pilus assembly protein [Roseovarius sp. Pro17]